MPVPESTLHFIGFVAVAASAGSMLGFDTPTRAVMALFSTFLWLVFGFSALDICPVEQCGNVAYTLSSLSYIGYGAALVMGMFFLQHGFRVLKEQMD